MSPQQPPNPQDSAFGTRLFAVEEDVRDLIHTMNTGFAEINAKLDERSKIQWPALTLALLAFTTIGTLVYWPVRERQMEMKEEIHYQTTEGLARDRRFLDMIIKVQMDIARIEGARGRN